MRTRSELRRSGERGVALLWSILIMLVVFATVTVAVNMTLVRTDETKDNANRTRSALFVQAAADDLVNRLQSREIGFDLVNPTANDGVDHVLTIPTAGNVAPAGSQFPNGAAGVAARRIQYTSSQGTTFRGWYQVLPMQAVGAALGTGPWQAVYRRSATSPQTQGSVEAVVRVWEEGARAEPVVARLTFRRASFARFSLLSDDRLSLGGVGNVRPGGFIHTNNARDEIPAIRIEGPPGHYSQVVRITSTRRGIQAPGNVCSGGRCVADVRDLIEFGSAARAFDRTRQLQASGPPGTGFYVHGPLPSSPPPIAGEPQIPVWWADVGSASCANGVRYGRGTISARQDTVGVAAIDDTKTPTLGPQMGCLNVAEGGGAVLFNGDVLVSGFRNSSRPVTIMAQRRSSVLVQQDTNGVLGTLESTRYTTPASIYVNATNFGSASDFRPVGLVAEGGVYMPSWIMTGMGVTTRVRNVAAMAMGSEVSYGPSIISIAAEAGEPGLGLRPSAARTLGYGFANRLEWTGSIASRRQIVFRYGGGNGCGGHVGYCRRDVEYAPNLIWNPPPGYPTDRDWHLADYREFRQ